ncbi:MAG: hypothetical protein Q8L49_15460 [Burkholderiaceae bacterium]|nr:hypothetical protein [Burkholderiaceae bacterium]
MFDLPMSTHFTAPFARRALCAALLCAGPVSGVGAAPTAGQVFTCVGPSGRTLTSDRLIAECMDREQRLLSREGLLLRIVPPTLTADERSEKEARDRRLAAEKEAKAEAARRDRNLVQRFTNAEAHQKARAAALADLRTSMDLSELRVRELASERKPLLDEAEFYQGKALPAKLREQLAANEGAIAAQRDAQNNQKAELERVNQLFDIELARLKRLWAGAAPGSLGPALAEAASAVAATPPAKPVTARAKK